jgi:molybdopterin-guanine dinucleotide biosynthesis protein A
VKVAPQSTIQPIENLTFSAVLLTGGKSSRMGYDKATAIIDGQVLWRRQIATLQAASPQELFISGRSDGPYVGQGFEVIADLHPGCGPLSGLEAACDQMRTPWLCVLAVDLPWMNASFLARLMEAAGKAGRGAVPLNGEFFEPLAAVYPRTMQTLIAEHLQGGDYSMQRIIRQAVELGLVEPYPLAAEDRALFRNVNTPADLAG